MKRIVSNYYDERSYWIPGFLEELYQEAKNENERTEASKMFLDYYNEIPWNTEIIWRYTHILNCELKNTDSLEEKLKLFLIIPEWAHKQPGVFYILEYYADALFNIVCLTKDNTKYSNYKDGVECFITSYPFVIAETNLNKKPEYKELFGIELSDSGLTLNTR
ncbi:MAG: hypothetical protein LBF83_08270 [Spirochaetaceae bacterium]|jgi:hypothetical protein|nr:hypothetical protein [Spirochaetaceae bacterium]